MVHKIRKNIAYIFAALLLCVTTVIGGQGKLSAISVRAGADDGGRAALNYETSNALDDLEKTTIDGESFSLEKYAFNARQKTTVLLFAEYCYGFYFDKQSNFGLYLYVWNPQSIAFDVSSGRNTVEMSYADGNDYVKYPITYLNRSEKSGYEGLFYKFKIGLTTTQKKEMLETLNSSKRIYHLSGIELLTVGVANPHDYEINAVYEYVGYAAGYGPNENADSLVYTKYEGEVFSITEEGIRQTFYRPSGSNGKNSYTQDTLQTVYFAVPNRLFEKYGVLSELRAEWLKAKTAWGLVTGTEEYYNAFLNCVGYSTKNTSPLWGTDKLPFTDYGLYASSTADNTRYTFNCSVSGAKNIPYLAYVLPTDEWGTDKADDYTVPWSEINEWMKNYHDIYDKSKTYTTPVPAGMYGMTYTFNPPYNGEYLQVEGYSKALFESWDNKKTVVDIPREQKLSLTSEKISQSWWQRLFGGSNVVSSTCFNDIEAIHCVESTDFKANKQLTCDGLYIDISDYDDFKSFYDRAAANDETVVLLRYDVGEYSALEAVEGIPYDGNGVLQGIKSGDTNARIFQMNVYIGFDIISLTFDNGEQEFVIPVVSDPIDAGSGSTGAIDTTTDKNAGKDLLKIIIALICLLILIAVLAPVLPLLVKGIVWLVALPFKLIGKAIKAIKKRGG